MLQLGADGRRRLPDPRGHYEDTVIAPDYP
jgi:hypothetical protein